MIMSFCKKGLHSFLGFTSFVDTSPPPPPHSEANALPSGAVGLSTATGDSPRGPNVLESTSVIPPPPPIKKDLGGFVDEVGGGVVDGLMSCTESLGFESSDDLSADEWYPARPTRPVERTRWREASERRKERKFPPPISSLNHKGQPSFFLRSVRTEGRLELTEVRIDRPEILRASREDGRLRLDLIVDEDKEIEEQEQEKEPKLITAAEDEEATEGEEQDEVDEWKRITVNGGEGFGRCHEAVNHQIFPHHHRHRHNLHDVWRQPCVPTR